MAATKTTSTVLGKRKSRASAPASALANSKPPKEKADPTPSISPEEAQAIFRRHFEAQFKPLSAAPAPAIIPDSAPEDLRSDDDDDDDDDENSNDESDASWSGVSDENGGDVEAESYAEEIEVVSHTKSSTPSIDPATALLSKREARAYLSSRVPLALTASSSSSTTSGTQRGQKRKSGGGAEDDEDAPSLLKNDLALQRLLSESHLFSSARSADAGGNGAAAAATVDTEHAGRNRHLATDLRLAALGSKRSIFAQQRMPMGIRKGIAGAAAAREAKRRKDARESGLVLERKASSGASATWLRGFGAAGGGRDRDRDRGARGRKDVAVDAPAVGKLRNGMLRLSKKDIGEIQGAGSPGSGPGRGGKSGKKRRR